jgi:hypothetical protein
LENLSLPAPCDHGANAILAALELQLAALDTFGAHIAAAHVDAAIQQLRRDLTRG